MCRPCVVRFTYRASYNRQGTLIAGKRIPATFTSELSDPQDSLPPGHTIVVGDVNCPGRTSCTVDERLTTLLSSHNLVMGSKGPTRVYFNDIVAESEKDRRLREVTVTIEGVSDH